ncbi:MAG: hypothetical protein ACXABY_07050 [Candidatus Thorarchaeota archaeon]
MGKICTYEGKYWYHGPNNDPNITWDMVRGPGAPRPKLRIRVKCPECGRRMIGQAMYCDDACCIFIRVPPGHKRKGWWKRGK